MLRVIKANNVKYKLKKFSKLKKLLKSCHHVIYLVSTWLKATEMEDNSEAQDNKVGSNLHVKFVVFILFERI